jgi:hypothetical protein
VCRLRSQDRISAGAGEPGQAVPVLLDEPGHQAAVQDLRAELRHSGTVERHDATPEEGRTDLPAGGGSSGGADSLVGPQYLTGRNLRDPAAACGHRSWGVGGRP